MSSILRLGDADLLRIRLSLVADPLLELQSAAHWPLCVDHPTTEAWARQTIDALGMSGRRVLADLRAPIVQVADLGHFPDPDGLTFTAALDGVLSQPTARWQTMSARLVGNGFAIDSDLAAGRTRALDRLASGLRTFHRAAIAPHWQRVSVNASTAAASWARLMATSGVGELLQHLHRGVVWTPPFLTVTQIEMCPRACCHWRLRGATGPPRLNPVSRRGLVIIPSVFTRNCIVNLDFEPPVPEVTSLIVPVPDRLTVFEEAPVRRGALSTLLGSTRSAVLLVCATDEVSTTQLASLVGVSVASASEHASVLRGAGLVRSRRDGQTVRHAATSAGLALITADATARVTQG